MAWTVRNHDAFDPEFDALPDEVQDELLAMTLLLTAYAPGLAARTPTLWRAHAMRT